MKKDVFSSWLKELCSLIFVQTFQAFLMAIVMSIIIGALAQTDQGTIDACGLLAVMALASFSKIELLLKNIFGLTSSYGDPSLAKGRQSFAGGMATIWGARRLLDNPRKIVAGGIGAFKGRVKMAKAKNDYLEAAAKGGDGTSLDGPGGNPRIPGPNPGAVAAGVAGAGKISELSSNIANLNDAVRANTDSNNKNSREDKLDKLKQAIADAKKERNDGLKLMVSGAAETVGAAHGAVAAGVIGLANGGDNLGKTMIQGAGAGDIIGDTITNITVNGIPDAAKTVGSAVKEGKRSFKNRDAYSQIEKNLKNDQNKKLDELGKKLDMYKNKSKNNSSNIDDV